MWLTYFSNSKAVQKTCRSTVAKQKTFLNAAGQRGHGGVRGILTTQFRMPHGLTIPVLLATDLVHGRSHHAGSEASKRSVH